MTKADIVFLLQTT